MFLLATRSRTRSLFTHPNLWALRLGAALLLIPATAASQAASADSPVREAVSAALERAFDARLTIWTRPDGARVHAYHCRSAAGGCRARIHHYAERIAEFSSEEQVDPFLVAAIVLRESGLNPFAEGTAGERGIVQLHPRGVGQDVAFVQNEAYRRRCRDRADACQDEVLRVGVRLLAASIRRCGGVRPGLGMYNGGTCQTTSYSRRVLAERARLLQLAKGVTPR